MGVESQENFVCVRACNLPSDWENVTSNKLLAFKDNKVRYGCRVSRAQAVRALSQRCLPCIRPKSDRLALAAHDDRNDWSSASGTATTNFLSFVEGVCCCPGSMLDASIVAVG